MAIRGIDVTRWSFGTANLPQLKAQGYGFVMSYVSTDPTKDWDRSMVDQVVAAGLDCVQNMETDATSGGLGGEPSGVQHGQMSKAAKAALGMADSRPHLVLVRL